MLGRRAACAAALLPLLPVPSPRAQGRYPVNPVTLVTHSSPGGGSDVFLRELIKHLQPLMGVGFAVENIRGGSGAAAVARVARSAPTGGMFYATTPTYIQTSLLSRVEVGWDGLDPMAIVFLAPAAAALGDNALVQFHLGEALLATGRKAEARAQFERVLALAGTPGAAPAAQTEAARGRIAVIDAPPAAQGERDAAGTQTEG